MKPKRNTTPKQQSVSSNNSISLEDYWNKNNRRQDQKFYTAFCLLNAAYCNYAVGAELSNNKLYNSGLSATQTLDWAATALYYSSVHCGRLACFLALSDFPTGHAELVNCFQKGKTKTKKTWMKSFIELADENKREEEKLKSELQLIEEFKRESIISNFAQVWKENESSDSESIKEKLEIWGEVLSQGKKLRTYCSYEGLLISNHYNHPIVSDSFINLCRALLTANEKLIKESTYLFKLFIDTSPRREYWYSFLNQSKLGLDYVQQSLANKVADNMIINKIKKIMLSDLQSININSDFAKEVENNIITGVFEGKNQLMVKFRDGASAFQDYVSSGYQKKTE
jgi:hypothetical protein